MAELLKLYNTSDFEKSVIPSGTVLSFYSKNDDGAVINMVKKDDGTFEQVAGGTTGTASGAIVTIDNIVNNKATLTGATLPIALTPDGASIYILQASDITLQSDSVVVDITNALAVLNLTDFVAPWYAYMACGRDGKDGKDGTVTFEELTDEQKALLKGEKGDTGPQGPQGEQGLQGPQGEQGPKGADGTMSFEDLTEEQKAVIVADVLNALPTWEGGSY